MGHWYNSPNEKRVIVAMHGWRSRWYYDFGGSARFWRESGCSVLYAEQRGQGDSGGDYMGFGLLERWDCLDWANWVDAMTGGAPIYLAGISMGASTVLMAAGMDLPESVRGVMADCGYTSVSAIWKEVCQSSYHLPYALVKPLADAFCRRAIGVGPDEWSAPRSLAQCRVPVLLIHGTEDSFVPVWMSQENYDACASPKELLLVPGADHGVSYLIDTETYEARVKAFWKKYDG